MEDTYPRNGRIRSVVLFDSHSISLWAFWKRRSKGKHHELSWLICLLTSLSSHGVQIHLSGFTKKLEHREHSSFAHVDRAELSLNLNPSWLSFSKFLCHFVPWYFPPALKCSSSLNLDRSKTPWPGKAGAITGFVLMNHWAIKLEYAYDYACTHGLISLKAS